MVFHDTGNAHNSLTHYINFLLGFAAGSITEFPLADKARATNTAKYELAFDIWRNADGWDFDDSGNSGLAEASANLVDDTQDVTIPTGGLQIKRVEVKKSDGDYERLIRIDEENIQTSIEEFQKTKGMPRYYTIHKNTVKLYPPPSTSVVTATNGILFFLNREVTEFTASTTTSEIGFDELGDRLVGHKVAYEFASMKGMSRAKFLLAKIQELSDKVLNHYANRSKDRKPKLTPVWRSYE